MSIPVPSAPRMPKGPPPGPRRRSARAGASARSSLLAAMALLLAGAPAPAADALLPGDVNSDFVVDYLDLGILSANYRQSGKTWPEGDLNADGRVDYLDLGILAGNYRKLLFDVTATLTNDTGQAKANWPVVLPIWKVFGGNLPLDRLNVANIRVFDPVGTELGRMIRPVPPGFSAGNDEIVFAVTLAAGASTTVRLTWGNTPGANINIDLPSNSHNLLPNGSFETDSGGLPTGYSLVAGSAGRVFFDTAVKHHGARSLRLTLPAGQNVHLRTTNAISFRSGGRYYFSIQGRSRNAAYTGYGFHYGSGAVNSGGQVYFDKIGEINGGDVMTGRDRQLLRETRDWHDYRLDAGAAGADGVPAMVSACQQTGASRLNLYFNQPSQNFLTGDKSGQVWLDEAILIEQPAVSVSRQAAVPLMAKNRAMIFSRPVDMPRSAACAHEAVASIEAHAFPGERRAVRLGVHAVAALSNVTVSLSALTGPGQAAIPVERIEMETLGDYTGPDAAVGALAAGARQEYLLGIDVPADQPPGAYRGSITLAAAGQTLQSLPLSLEVLATALPAMSDYYVGGIYNVGFPLARDDDFYRAYGKCRFNYLMLFDYFSTHVADNNNDLPGAAAQVQNMRSLGCVTAGIGLYREPNMSDDQPRKWYQMAGGIVTWPGKYKANPTYNQAYKTGYQDLAEGLENYSRDNGWPRMVYMVTDEPGDARDVDPAMGWLNQRLPDAITVADAQYKDMIATWSWYNLPIIDDPADWSGPLIYAYIRANKGRFGFCGPASGLGLGLGSARYQHGLNLAAAGSKYLHWWHTSGPFQKVGSRVERAHHVCAMAAGFADLRYYQALVDAIAAAQGTPRQAVAAEAQAYLTEVFSYSNADNDRHLLPYNGIPYDWGDDRWYDRWQARMKDYLVRLSAP